ncbi:transglycosylase SLT domain-containing protein [Haliscomenobacter sp.]|uniref:lytic transglycosylase domain-containing protein n=1 Tax=Haliscomenobacter sp. TaxID=2717303 RepID=UPI0035944770
MNFPWTVATALVIGLTASPAVVGAKAHKTEVSIISSKTALTETLVKERLVKLSLPIEVKTSESVMTRIRQYIGTGKKETELVIGRSNLYFSVFEHYLNQYGLPEELKYLSVIESGLQPQVRSAVGASGIWQLMPIAARHYGLLMGGGVDERLDLYRSTEAAVQMLKYLHDELGDWTLVLAAYNSGIGTIKSAVRKAGTKNYSVVSKYLPHETRRYVPAYLATAYVMSYYHKHDLKPVIPFYYSPDARVVRIYRTLSFGEIARISGVKTSVIAALNPSFTSGIIPRSAKGHLLMLPNSESSLLLRSYLDSNSKLPFGTIKTAYVTTKGDDLSRIATLFSTTVDNLVKWNDIREGKLVINQELVLYLPKAFFIKRA